MDISNTASAAGPHTIAKACSETMWAQDHASKALGMKLERIAPGEAIMAVRADMTNGTGSATAGLFFHLRIRPLHSLANLQSAHCRSSVLGDFSAACSTGRDIDGARC